MRQKASRLITILGATTLATAGVIVAPAAQQRANSQQPAAAAGAEAAKTDLDDLEKHPEKYVGKTVTVEGEVDRILGPHLFTIDESNWVDLDREMPVIVPDPFAAIVRSDSPVRVTGTVQKVPIAQIELVRGLLSKDEKIRAEIETQPALVASEVTTIAPVAVSLRVRTDPPAGTAGTAGMVAGPPITDINQVASATDTKLVGRRVDLKNAPVSGASADGFWIRLPSGQRLFVMPVKKTDVRDGQTVAIQGLVLELPEALRTRLNAKDEQIYIFADAVTAH